MKPFFTLGKAKLKKAKKSMSKGMKRAKDEANSVWEAVKEVVPKKFERKMEDVKRKIKNRKTRPTVLRNGVPYDIEVVIECKYFGKWTYDLKPNKTIPINSLNYSKWATLSCTLKGYLGQNWTYVGNLRKMINPKRRHTKCLFTYGDDAAEQKETDLFIYKIVKDDGQVEATLYSFLSVINDTKLNVTCEQIMLDSTTEILRPNKADPPQPLFIRGVIRELNFTVDDNSIEKGEASAVDNGPRFPIRFGITSPTGLGKLITISVPSSDKVNAHQSEELVKPTTQIEANPPLPVMESNDGLQFEVEVSPAKTHTSSNPDSGIHSTDISDVELDD